VTTANIRYHLKGLIAEGYVVVTGRVESPHRGRPTLLYSSTLNAVKSDLTPLIRSLWDELLGTKTRKQREDRMEKLAGRLVRGRPPLDKPGNLPQHLNRTVQILNSLGYRSRWEAHAEAPRMILEHCPFDSIYESLPELCDIDACVLTRLLGRPVQQINRRKLIAGRGSACVFQLRDRP
jgi:predicted ArsR family transcriptional regulator